MSEEQRVVKRYLVDGPTTLKCMECELYFEVDRDNLQIYISDYVALVVYKTTRGLLVEVNSAIAEILEEYFEIELEEYGVELIDREDVVIPLDESYRGKGIT